MTSTPLTSMPKPRKWGGTGFAEVTVWKILKVIVIPLTLVVLTVLVNFHLTQNAMDQQEVDQGRVMDQQKIDQRRVMDQQEQTTLEAYMNRTSDLLVSKDVSTQLHASHQGDEVRKVAEAFTLIALNRLKDADRKRAVVEFLYQADLITRSHLILDIAFAHLDGAKLNTMLLSHASLTSVYLNGADLNHSLLIGTSLQRSMLDGVNLNGADLNGADLSTADLKAANLNGADLRGANLKGALGITSKELKKEAKLLQGAIMPDGSKFS